jgi:hypothetical protein
MADGFPSSYLYGRLLQTAAADRVRFIHILVFLNIMTSPIDQLESKVLVIYTGMLESSAARTIPSLTNYVGGTIGMLLGPHGYVPEPYFLTETLRSQTRFHDPFQDSLFSNSSSIEGFREWSSLSGRSSPQSSSPSGREADKSLSGSLLVRSTQPFGPQATSFGTSNDSHRHLPLCTKISDHLYQAYLPSLITPKTLVPDGTVTRRIRYAVLEVRSDDIKSRVLTVTITSVDPPLGQ